MVLAVFPGLSVSVLDSKFRAAVQAAKAHNSLLLYQYWSAVFHFNGMCRALPGTQSASDTVLRHFKVSCISRVSVIQGESDLPGKVWPWSAPYACP